MNWKIYKMHIVIFTHPNFLDSQSMSRYANYLIEGMCERGHNVVYWTARARFYKLKAPKSLKKWLGYIDQYIVFPFEVMFRLFKQNKNTLFVFTDHALGPWVPLVKNRNHIIHCHDFIALQSAQGFIKENQTKWTGKYYQAYIRWGFKQGKNFICISQKTQEDLHTLLGYKPKCSEIVYNGLNQPFVPRNVSEVRALLSKQFKIDLQNGYLLHVGGNQFYKNRKGVIELYSSWRKMSSSVLPLLMIGQIPTSTLIKCWKQTTYKNDIYFLDKINDVQLRKAYQGASIFLFPSLAEGFGWPIAEAMASGCPVLTTDEAPMSEVAGDAGFLIPRQPLEDKASKIWAYEAATLIEDIILMEDSERALCIQKGLINSKRFDPVISLNRIEQIYRNILKRDEKPCT